MRKGVWENTSKKSHRWRVKNKTTFLSEHTCANPHMHNTGKSLEGTFSLNMSCDALSYGGGVQTIPLVKQRLQNSQNVWNSQSVSHLLLAQTNQSQVVCTCVGVTGPLPSFVRDIVNKRSIFRFYFPNFLTRQIITFKSSKWLSD